LTEQFNQVSSGLSTVTSSLNTSIQNGVTAVNQDLSQIASLNQQIMVAQGSGGTADQLEDEREQTIENLAGYVNLTTSAQANGTVNVDVGGANMVTGDTVTNTLRTESSDGQLSVGLVNDGELTLTSGSIAGSMAARDGAVTTLQSSLDTLAGQLITQVNNVYQNGTDLNGNSGQAFFTGSDAANIGVNDALANDPSAFQASSTGQPGDNGVVLAMAQLADTALPDLNNQTMSQYYSQAVGSFGSSLQSVNEQLTNSTSVAQMLTTQRASASGVNTDTEMTNLLQFQKAYEASAELISTVNEMLSTLVNMKTE
jgi:flagellar hook-associated protein 1 FlgK